jgi:hypothetical protein
MVVQRMYGGRCQQISCQRENDRNSLWLNHGQTGALFSVFYYTQQRPEMEAQSVLSQNILENPRK